MALARVLTSIGSLLGFSPPREWRAPQNTRIYAIGDIHGRSDLLELLHEQILEDARSCGSGRLVAVYIGDYVDRGLQSRKVIDLLLNKPLEGFENVYLKGNHDAWLLSFLEDYDAGPSWFATGGQATLISYGVGLVDGGSEKERLEKAQRELKEFLPPSHLQFLERLALWHVEGDYLFVHAGIKPGVGIEKQVESDLLWIREEFLDSERDHGFRVVHGHSVTDNPDIQRNRIGIDTGAFATNRLTSIVFEGSSHWFLSS